MKKYIYTVMLIFMAITVTWQKNVTLNRKDWK